MSSSNWTVLTDSLGLATVDRGVTAGIPRPSGGGTFLYGFNSLALATGAVGLIANQAGFAPMTNGGTIRGAIQRGVSGGPENFAPFFFIGLQGPSVNDSAYILGLGDDDPHHIVLKKGALVDGLPDLSPDAPNNGVMMRSTATYEPGTWLHLRLDMIVQGTGDVLLQVYMNNLDDNLVSAPVWELVPGMEGPQYPSITGYIDDALAVNTGSAPYTNGRVGFGFQTADTQRRGYFDHLVVGKQ